MKLFTLLMILAAAIICYHVQDAAIWGIIVYGVMLSPILLIAWCVRREHAIDKLIANNGCNCGCKNKGRN